MTVNAASTKKVEFSPAARTALRLVNPKLWWPVGYGDPNLYPVSISFVIDGVVSDKTLFQAGVRQFTYSEDGGLLKIWINGRRFIPRGGNWGFPESMLRYRSREYNTALRYHRDEHFNMIRNWVGQTGDEAFYDAADRNGVVVWQDFWLANPWDGPDPDDNDLFLHNARDYLLRIRNHASMGLFCGRNEGLPPRLIDEGLRDDGRHRLIPDRITSRVRPMGRSAATALIALNRCVTTSSMRPMWLTGWASRSSWITTHIAACLRGKAQSPGASDLDEPSCMAVAVVADLRLLLRHRCRYYGAKKLRAAPYPVECCHGCSGSGELQRRRAGGLTAHAQVIDIDGTVKWEKNATLAIHEDSTESPMQLEFPTGLARTHFIRLTLTRGGDIVSVQLLSARAYGRRFTGDSRSVRRQGDCKVSRPAQRRGLEDHDGVAQCVEVTGVDGSRESSAHQERRSDFTGALRR